MPEQENTVPKQRTNVNDTTEEETTVQPLAMDSNSDGDADTLTTSTTTREDPDSPSRFQNIETGNEMSLEQPSVDDSEHEPAASSVVDTGSQVAADSRPGCRQHLILEINHDSKQASLQECHNCAPENERESDSNDEDDRDDDWSPGDGSDDEYSYNHERGISQEEEYEQQVTTKASQKSGGHARPKRVKKKQESNSRTSKRLKPREAHKRQVRQEEKAQERAERERLIRQVGEEASNVTSTTQQNGATTGTAADSSSRDALYMELLAHATESHNHNRSNNNDSEHGLHILSAQELGVQDGDHYSRLMEIALDGDDITPEDFDLLLQLDANNKKATMKKSDIANNDNFELLVIGKTFMVPCTKQDESDKKDTKLSCLICLESFENLPLGTHVRRLPCQHVFCKSCIDEWLLSNSTKCPQLSCFWTPQDENHDETKEEQQEA